VYLSCTTFRALSHGTGFNMIGVAVWWEFASWPSKATDWDGQTHASDNYICLSRATFQALSDGLGFDTTGIAVW
jgi:hypothetical protein